MLAICANTSRSQFPSMKLTGVSTERSKASVSRGCGPNVTSPPTTIRSTPTCSTSCNTASSAVTFPCTSYSAATRINHPPNVLFNLFNLKLKLGVEVEIAVSRYQHAADEWTTFQLQLPTSTSN